MISPSQIRAARSLLGLTQAEVAERVGIAVITLKRAESDEAAGKVSADALADIQRVLERAGVAFIPENGGGAGVRLAKPSKPHRGTR